MKQRLRAGALAEAFVSTVGAPLTIIDVKTDERFAWNMINLAAEQFVDITELMEAENHLEEALTKTLSGFVKICSSCKNIRHDDEWQPIEQYASEQMDYHDFNHGMCESCAKKLYGDGILDS